MKLFRRKNLNGLGPQHELAATTVQQDIRSSSCYPGRHFIDTIDVIDERIAEIISPWRWGDNRRVDGRVTTQERN
jgi:hypothetical protein